MRAVCSRPKEEYENRGAGSWRMRKHPSKVFLVLFVHKENGSLPGKYE